MIRQVGLCMVGLILSGCGVTFDKNYSIPENALLPPTIKASVPATIYRHDITSLTGQIAVVDREGNVTPVIKAIDSNPPYTVIPDADRLLYRSVISSGYEGNLKNAIGDIKLKNGQKAEVEVNQIAYSFIADLPVKQINSQRTLINPANGQKLVYISKTVLSLSKTQLLDEQEDNSSITYGPVVGFNGKIYKQSSQVLNNYIVTLGTVDLDLIKNPELDKNKAKKEEDGSVVYTLDQNVAKKLTLPAPTANVPASKLIDDSPPSPPPIQNN